VGYVEQSMSVYFESKLTVLIYCDITVQGVHEAMKVGQGAK